MSPSLPTRSTIAAMVAGLVLVACDPGTATVQGKVTDEEGSQAQLHPGSTGSEKLGGSGTMAATSTVRIAAVTSTGGLNVLAEAQVNAQGEYTAEVPAGHEHLVVQAVSASGEVLAQAILESSGSAGQTRTAPPMDGESSVEAEVLLAMAAEGVALADINPIDLRALINSEVAAEVRQSSASSASDGAAQVKALAQGAAAAQRSRIEWYSRRGVNTSQSALFRAQLQAAENLNAALHAGSTSKAQAYESFYAAIRQADESQGVDEQTRAEGESNASAAFRATVEAKLSASLSASGTVSAALRAAASAEARAASAAIEAMLSAAGAASSVQSAAVSAGQQLRADIAAATSAAAAAQAFANYNASISGGADVNGSVLGNFLEVNTTNEATVEASINVASSAAAELGTTLDSALDGLLGLTGSIDLVAVADATADAYQAYRATVVAEATSLATFGSKADVAVGIMVVAHGSYR